MKTMKIINKIILGVCREVKHKTKPQVFVSHGRVTHKIGAKCKFCEKVQREFEKDLASGKVDRMLRKYKIKPKKETK